MSDSSFWCNLQQSSFLAFTDEGFAVWQPLAGEDVAFGLVPEHGVTLLVHLKHAIAGGEKDVAVVQKRQVV